MTENILKRIQWDGVNNMKVISGSIRSPLGLSYPNIFVGSWAGANHNHIPKNFPAYLLTSIMALLIAPVLQSQAINARQTLLQYSVQNITSSLFALPSFHRCNYISDQYFHQPANVSNQSQLSRVHMKQIDLTVEGYYCLSNHNKLIQTS